MCEIITFPAARSAAQPAVVAVELCEGVPERLFDLVSASLAMAKTSDNFATDPIAVECMQTAFVALSELLGFTGEARL